MKSVCMKGAVIWLAMSEEWLVWHAPVTITKMLPALVGVVYLTRLGCYLYIFWFNCGDEELCYVSEAGKKDWAACSSWQNAVNVGRHWVNAQVVRMAKFIFSSWDFIQHHINDRGIDAVEQVINTVFTWAVLYGVSLAPQLVTWMVRR